MRIRVKLLVLLLVIGLVPVATVTWYELRGTRALGLEGAGRARQVLEERATRQMVAAVRGAAALAGREMRLLEGVAQEQAKIVEAVLVGGAGTGRSITHESVGSLQPDALVGSVHVDTGAVAVITTAKVELGRLVSGLARLRQQFPSILWQRIGTIGNGVQVVYPAHVDVFEPRTRTDEWLSAVLEQGAVVVSQPHPDAWSGLPVLTIALPLRDTAGAVIGATAIEADLNGLIAHIPEELFEAARIRFIEPTLTAGEERGVRIIAEHDGTRLIATHDILGANGIEGVAEVWEALQARRSGVRRIAFEEGDEFWAYAPIGDTGSHLLRVESHRDLIADVLAAEEGMLRKIDDRRAVIRAGLLVFVSVIVGLALLASRAITRPVGQLAEAARELADGNFNARTNIRSGDELEELGRLFNDMVPQLAASMRMRDSLNLAQEVQQNLLPAEPPNLPGLDIYGVSLYCDETGGDYFDFMPMPALGPSALTLMIGDVAGHGVSAALLMTTARALLRAREARPGRLAERVGEVNRHLCRDAHGGRFMTLFMAVLDADAQRINWVGAGHGNGFIFDPAQEAFMEITGPDIPLGVDPGWHFEELSHTGWSPGTVMLVGTDGIWETRNPAGMMFGKQAVRRLIRANADQPAAEIAAKLIAALGEFRGGKPQIDDVTMVVVKAI